MDAFSLIAAERLRLAEALDALPADAWEVPSLCGAWTVHEVAAHLNVPFEVSSLQFVVGMLKARGSFDRANERTARDLARRMGPAACAAGLRANAASRFTPPGSGPEAPLTDVIVHGCDILQPLGRRVAVAPEALAVAIPAMAEGRRGFPGKIDPALRLEPDDVDLVVGTGDQVVTGPGRSILAVMLGRDALRSDLGGPGASLLGRS